MSDAVSAGRGASAAGIAGMVRDLGRLGLRPGDCLLVHASLRSLGRFAGGAEAVIRALLAALGPDGTLALPALSYATVTAANPSFHQLDTPSCVGYLPEYFRTRAGTRRSLHPTHSVAAVGALAEVLLDGHERDDTPCGPNSPFRRLPGVGGRILMLGCGMRPNTSMHAVEELTVPPYLYGDPVTYSVTDGAGRSFSMTVRRHGFAGWAQRYDRVAALLGPESLRCGRVLDAEAFLIDTPVLWQAAEAALRRDPFHFVEPRAR